MESLDDIPIVRGIIRWLRGDRPDSHAPDRPSDSVQQSHRRFSRRPPESDGRDRPPAVTDRRLEDIARAGQKAWVSVGQTVTVQGRTLPGGMIYVGSRLRGISPHASIEPALVNPKLAGAHPTPDRSGDLMDYWPSYSHLAPASRTAYLDWLAAGRPGGAYIGYVFLFFYGIERRVLFDAAYIDEARAEIPALIDEVERLIDLYQGNSSFQGYAGSFLSFAPLIRGAVDVGDLTPPLTRRGWDFPVELKLALGAIVNASEPLPAPWALSWLRMHPDIRLRTPATRCADEFNELFRIRYQAQHGDGMTIRRNKTPLKLSYHPASASLHDAIKVDAGDLPDVCRLKAPVRRLQQVAGTVTEELDAYSRWVGRHDDRESLAAIALLPRELAETRQPAELRRLLERIETAIGDNETATLPVPDLIAEYPSRKPNITDRPRGDGLHRTAGATWVWGRPGHSLLRDQPLETPACCRVPAA